MSLLKPALFLDRDGVINVDYGYVYKSENFYFIDGIFELVATANKLDFLVVVVTNQAGIGRGYYSEHDFQVLTQWMKDRLALQNSRIDAVYFCPNHPQHGVGKYLKYDGRRKPDPGMFFDAANELNIDLINSIMVGDKDTDMQAALAAGIKKHLLYSSKSKFEIHIENLSDAIPHLESVRLALD